MGNILNGKVDSIFSAVNHGKTLQYVASRYKIPFDQFLKELEDKVGEKKYRQLKATSDKNSSKPQPIADVIITSTRGKGEKKMAVAKKQQEQTTKTTNKQEATITMGKKTREQLEKEVAKAKRALGVAKRALSAEEILLESEKSKLLLAEKERDTVKELLKKKEDAVEEARNAVKGRELTFNEKVKSYTDCQRALENIEAELAEMNRKVIYLVAPGYKGKLPEVGRCIATLPMDGVTVDTGTDLMKEPSVMDLLSTGYKMIDEALNAYNFARLVIKYTMEAENTDDVKILCDDERITKILKDQGLEL